jgi:hypothetical protein
MKRRNVVRCRRSTTPSDPPQRKVETHDRATALQIVVVLPPLSLFGGSTTGWPLGMGCCLAAGFACWRPGLDADLNAETERSGEAASAVARPGR